MKNVRDLASEDGYPSRHVAGTGENAEYHGPCPFCGGGDDRFVIKPNKLAKDGTYKGGSYWCRKNPEEHNGDPIQYLREYRKMRYNEACRYLGIEPKRYENRGKKSQGTRNNNDSGQINPQAVETSDTGQGENNVSANPESPGKPLSPPVGEDPPGLDREQNPERLPISSSVVEFPDSPPVAVKGVAGTTGPYISLNEQYQKRAKALLEFGVDTIWSSKGKRALSHLNARGLNNETIKAIPLGYNPQHLKRTTRKQWGLVGEEHKDKKMHLSKGIIIPCWYAKDQTTLFRIRIRLDKPMKDGTRYIVMAGCKTDPMIIDGQHAVTIIVESELDGWLLWQEAGDLVNIVALGSVSKRSDENVDALLKKSRLVLFSLDYDDVGPEHFLYWKKLCRSRKIKAEIKPWASLKGKDPSEDFKQGVNLRTWIKAAFPWPGQFMDLYEERAAIMQYEGGLSREEAERCAFEETLKIEKTYSEAEKRKNST